jgi:hypothetical protein
MSEHEVPTVARATLWLDTSNETSTRPSECIEDCATRAFERLAEPRSEPTPAVQPAETAVLDRSLLIAAIDQNVTDAFDPEPPLVRDGRARLPAWRSVATHALSVLAGVAMSAAVLAAPQPRQAVAHAEPRIEQPASAPSPTKPPAPPEATPPDTATVRASLSDAVDALARGDYAAARIEYEALARQRPNDAALSAVAAILAAGKSGRCTDQARKDGTCAR